MFIEDNRQLCMLGDTLHMCDDGLVGGMHNKIPYIDVVHVCAVVVPHINGTLAHCI